MVNNWANGRRAVMTTMRWFNAFASHVYNIMNSTVHALVPHISSITSRPPGVAAADYVIPALLYPCHTPLKNSSFNANQ